MLLAARQAGRAGTEDDRWKDGFVDDSTPGAMGRGPSGPVAERMQALLSRAVEDQASEQRQVTTVLSEIRHLVAGLSEQLRGTASDARVESLSGDLAALSADLRSTTTGMGERLDVLTRRVEEQAASSAETAASGGAGVEQLGMRVSEIGRAHV